MRTKALRGLKITDEQEGRVQAVFATLNVKDKDGDVTVNGAFENGSEVRISAYNHASWGPGVLPVGKGVIREVGDEAILDSQFFLSTAAGKDTFTTIKELGDLVEWSYGYDILEAEPGQKDGQNVQILKRLKVHEVSPVLLGAGENTRTLFAKAASLSVETEQDAAALESGDAPKGTKLVDHLTETTEAVKTAVNRLVAVKALRAEDGKRLSDDATSSAKALLAEAERIRDVLTIEPQINQEWVKQQHLLSRALELRARGGATP